MSADFSLHASALIFFLTPESDAGQLWMEETVPLDQRRSGALFLASDEVMPLIQSLVAEGYTVQQ